MALPAPFRLEDDLLVVDLPGARAVFTTRATGNLGLLTDDPEVPARRQALQERLGIELAWRKQVHGHRVDRVDAPTDPTAPWIEADGVITTTPGVAPLVLGADCLTVVLSDGQGVAAVHAGWHGLDERILEVASSQLGPGPVAAAIGPAAGACCYAVGDELHERFAAYDASRGRNLDLTAIARQQLERAGVTTIHDVGLCTLCTGPRTFFSHRADGPGTGRQAGIGWLRDG